MPIDMAMQKPGARVVRGESEGDIVCTSTYTDNIAANRVVVVVRRASGNAHDVKGMSVEMDGVLRIDANFKYTGQDYGH